ncbi:hypothetical protein [Streptomyces lasiicapitis]|uniref:Uncharacterized protein n=1 Tax=Streptomyces lasiicapitis TaxID=1923961 RepID=A0ABQ2MLB3_9ACTN|nr:hypothetical protein [Streptomyces lasiicapitis]GGO54651.1 hypothetical protein GCM10012286_64920 [Streptomyces lasiicapitis]
MIVRRYVDADDELGKHLARVHNISLDRPAESDLNAGLIAHIAAAAACDVSYNQAANGHLVDLFAALPLPGTPEGREFWDALTLAGGQAVWNIVPGNAGGPFFDYLLNGNEGGIAGRVLGFLDELDDKQRDAVAKVIGDALDHRVFVGGARYLGKLWLQDAETTAWHVLLASGVSQEGEEGRQRFLEAWRNA